MYLQYVYNILVQSRYIKFTFVDTIVTRTTQSGDKTQATIRFTEFASRQRNATIATSIGRFFKNYSTRSVA